MHFVTGVAEERSEHFVRMLTKGRRSVPLAAVDEGGPHPIRLCANAIEGMIRNKQNAGSVMTNELFRFRIGLPVWLEIAGFLHRNDVIERKANVRSGGLEHVSAPFDRIVSLYPWARSFSRAATTSGNGFSLSISLTSQLTSSCV